jgi:hypothetical protein
MARFLLVRVEDRARVTGKPESCRSSVGLLPRNALVLTEFGRFNSGDIKGTTTAEAAGSSPGSKRKGLTIQGADSHPR